MTTNAKPRTLEPEVFERMLERVDQPVQRAFLLLLRYTGMRVGEASNLEPGDFYWEAGTRYILIDANRRGNKSTSSRRIPLPDKPRLREALARWERVRFGTRYYFHTQTGERYHTEYVRNLCKKLGKAEGVRFTPHMLRHMFATEILSQDLEALESVSNYLGHKDTATTLNMYLHVVRPLDPGKYIE